MATKKLNELLPPLSSSGKSQRKVIREAKQFIDKTRAETITLLVSNLQDLGVMRYSGLFLEGGRFDCYEGKVPPASRAAQISNRIKHVADNLKIDLKPYFVQGFTGGVCVHIDILGDPVYLG